MAGKTPLIVVKRKKSGGGGHHGGSWKVAYADFVTAMMAFFLVLWLITALDKDQRAALFDYFKNPSLEEGHSTRAAPAQMGPGGASTSPINLGGGLDSPRTAMAKNITLVDTAKVPGQDPKQAMEAARAAAEEADRRKLQSLLEELRAAIENSQALEPYKDQLLLDVTPEGLRIQIVDKQNRPMFDVGSARLKDYTTNILHELANYLNTVPNHLAISGHTDVRPYPGGSGGYSNWELSSDRANAARRALQDGGLSAEKVARVVGLSSTVLFDKDSPENPINRRISIIVMTKAVEDSEREKNAATDASAPPGVPVTNAAGAPIAGTSVAAAPTASAPAASSAPVIAPPAAAAPKPGVAPATTAPAAMPSVAALKAVADAAVLPRPTTAAQGTAVPAGTQSRAAVAPPLPAQTAVAAPKP